MKLSDIGELSLLEIIRRRFSHRSKNLIVGIGDDAAAIKSQPENLLFTTDMMTEGIHFDLSFITPYQLGFKLVSVNVSDIYAMGGKPQYMLLDIAMTKKTEQSFLNRFFDGIQDALKLYKLSLVGGDMSSSKRDLAIAAMLIGYAEKPIRRSGAKTGDRIYVTGNLGDSACGLEVLKKFKKPVLIENILSPHGKKMGGGEKSQLAKLGLTWNAIAILIQRHLMPEARNPGNYVADITSMIDISDGLFIDLSRLCNESRVGASIYKELLPVSQQMKKASIALGIDPFKLAVSGGEDYELLFTAPQRSKLKIQDSGLKITCIGEIIKKNMVIADKAGRESAIKAMGYQHFGIKRQI